MTQATKQLLIGIIFPIVFLNALWGTQLNEKEIVFIENHYVTKEESKILDELFFTLNPMILSLLEGDIISDNLPYSNLDLTLNGRISVHTSLI